MQVCVFVFQTERLVLSWIEFKYSVLVLSGNMILTTKLRILRYFLRTFLALLSRALVITSSPCLHIAINPSLVRNEGTALVIFMDRF